MRRGPLAVVAGVAVLVVAGVIANQAPSGGVDSLASLNGVGESSVWRDAGALPSGRHQHAVAAVDDWMFSLGGLGFSGGSADTVASSDGLRWTSGETLNRYDHCTVVFGDRVFILGGHDGVSAGPLSTVLVGEVRGDGQLDVREGGSLPVAVQAAACAVYQDRIWLIGGTDRSGPSTKVFSSPDGVTWSERARLPRGVSYASAVVFDEQLLVIGGNVTETTATKEIYATDGSSWEKYSALPAPAAYHASIVYDGKIWVIGGRDDSSYLSASNRVVTSPDGKVWSAEVGLRLPVALRSPGVLEFKGMLWVLGGARADGAEHHQVFRLEQ